MCDHKYCRVITQPIPKKIKSPAMLVSLCEGAPRNMFRRSNAHPDAEVHHVLTPGTFHKFDPTVAAHSPKALPSQTQPIHAQSVHASRPFNNAEPIESLLAIWRTPADIPLLAAQRIAETLARAVRTPPAPSRRNAGVRRRRRTRCHRARTG